MSLFNNKKKSPENENVDKIKPKKEKVKKDKSIKKEATPRKEFEKSDIAKQFGIRVSNPYGYFPEDVDRILEDLQSQLINLSKENKFASDKLDRITKERDDAKTELTKLKMQVSLMDVPDTSTEEDFHMLSRLSSINPKVGTIPDNVPDPSTFTGKIEPVIADKIESDEPKDDTPKPETYDNLVRVNNKKPKVKNTTKLEKPQIETKPIVEEKPIVENIPTKSEKVAIEFNDDELETQDVFDDLIRVEKKENKNPIKETNKKNRKHKSTFDLEILGGDES